MEVRIHGFQGGNADHQTCKASSISLLMSITHKHLTGPRLAFNSLAACLYFPAAVLQVDTVNHYDFKGDRKLGHFFKCYIEMIEIIED